MYHSSYSHSLDEAGNPVFTDTSFTSVSSFDGIGGMFNIFRDVQIDQISLVLSSISDDIVFSLSPTCPIPVSFVNFSLSTLWDYLPDDDNICSSSYSAGYYDGYIDAA